MPDKPSRRFEVDVVGDETVVKFLDRRLDDSNMETVEKQLLLMASQKDGLRLTLDLSRVEHLTSISLAKFVSIHKKVAAAGGRVVLVNVGPKIVDVFERTRLTQILTINPPTNEEPTVDDLDAPPPA
jgi:anti-anti-sigma factor